MGNRIFFHSPIRYIVSFVLSTCITVAYLFSTNFKILKCYADGMLAGGAFSVLFGLLVLVIYLGAFDTFAYGFKRIFNRTNGKYNDLVEYENVMKEKRSKNKFIFVPYLVVGVLFILVSIILFIIG